MERILLSQEFQTLVPIFLMLLLIFVVLVLHLLYKIILERKRKKLEREFETDVLNFLQEGEPIMNGQDIVNAALSGATQTASGTGRQQEITKLLGKGFQNLIHQSTGLVQTGRQLALAQALRGEMQVGAEMVAGMQAAAQAEGLVLEVESSEHVKMALGGETTPQSQEDAPQQIAQASQQEDETSSMRQIIRNTPYLAQEVRILLRGDALNGEFEFTPELKTTLVNKLRQQERSGCLKPELQQLLAFLQR